MNLDILLYFLAGIYVLDAVGVIRSIGKPRKPVTVRTARLLVVTNLVVAVSLILLALGVGA
jgi:hypothetical protein